MAKAGIKDRGQFMNRPLSNSGSRGGDRRAACRATQTNPSENTDSLLDCFFLTDPVRGNAGSVVLSVLDPVTLNSTLERTWR